AEAWVKVNPGEGRWSILDYDRSEYFTFAIGLNDGGNIGVEDKVNFHTADSTGQIHNMSGNTIVADGLWHHVAVVYDGADKIIYVDGKEDARSKNPHAGRALGTGMTRYGFIGTGSEANSPNGARNPVFYKGALRDVRLWTTARS